MLQAAPKPVLVILDDLMPEAKSNYLDKIFTRGSHHWDMSVIFVTQHMFNKELRTARANSQYLVCLKNPAGELQMRNLGIQLFPNKQKFFTEAYKNATRNQYGYLLIDLHPKTANAPVLMSNIFPGEKIFVYQMAPTGDLLPSESELIENPPRVDILRDPKDSALLEVNESLGRILQDPHLSNTEKYLQYDQILKKQRALMKDKEEKLQNVSLNALGPELMSAFASLSSQTAAQPSNTQPIVTQPQNISQPTIQPLLTASQYTSTQPTNQPLITTQTQ